MQRGVCPTTQRHGITPLKITRSFHLSNGAGASQDGCEYSPVWRHAGLWFVPKKQSRIARRFIAGNNRNNTTSPKAPAELATAKTTQPAEKSSGYFHLKFFAGTASSAISNEATLLSKFCKASFLPLLVLILNVYWPVWKSSLP